MSDENTFQGQKNENEWKEQLTPEQYRITREKGTEAPFSGEYVDCKKDGTYRCIGCGVELFDSSTKFDSGSGWPSFADISKAEKYWKDYKKNNEE